MELKDIIKPLHEMTDAEIQERIRQIRTGRRDPILRKPKGKAAAAKKQKQKQLDLNLDATQAEELLKYLGVE